jgi:hypothetical protein
VTYRYDGEVVLDGRKKALDLESSNPQVDLELWEILILSSLAVENEITG